MESNNYLNHKLNHKYGVLCIFVSDSGGVLEFADYLVF